MASNFQNETPRARINIALDIEQDGARKKKELPMKLLAIGNFSGGKNTKPVAERERININKSNFNNVMQTLGPELNLIVPNQIKANNTDLRVHLSFDSINTFRPEAVANQVPELQRLLAMRNLLKELKANIVDNNALRRTLENTAKNKMALRALQKELQQRLTTETSNEGKEEKDAEG